MNILMTRILCSYGQHYLHVGPDAIPIWRQQDDLKYDTNMKRKIFYNVIK